MMDKNDLLGFIKDFVDSNAEEMSRDLSRLVQLRTVSGETDEDAKRRSETDMRKGFDLVKLISEPYGLVFTDHDGLVATLDLEGDGEGWIGILLHLDVVPATASDWEHPPFCGHIDEEGTVWGRGSVDDKGGLVASLYGMIAVSEYLKQRGIRLEKSLKLVIGTWEEGGDWGDMHSFFSRVSPPDFCIVPDGAFPINSAEKGMLDVKFFSSFPESDREDAGENEVEFVEIVSGERVNVVPDRAKIIFGVANDKAARIASMIDADIEKFLKDNPSASLSSPKAQIINDDEEGNLSRITLELRGIAAHGSLPQLGHNAGMDALNFVSSAKILPERSAQLKFIRFVKDRCADMNGKGLGIATHHDFMGDLTINPAIVRIDANKGEVTINIRHVLGITAEGINESLQQIANEESERLAIELDSAMIGKKLEPIYVDADKYAHYIEPLRTAFLAITGEQAQLNAMGGTTYAKTVPLGVSFGPAFTIEECTRPHKTNEYMTLDSLKKGAKIYGISMALLASGC